MIPLGPAAPCGSGGSHWKSLDIPSQEAETASRGAGKSSCGAGDWPSGAGEAPENRTAGREAIGGGNDPSAREVGETENVPPTIKAIAPRDCQLYKPATKFLILICILIGKIVWAARIRSNQGQQHSAAISADTSAFTAHPSSGSRSSHPIKLTQRTW